MSGTTSVFDQPLNGDIDDVAEGLVILIDGDTAPRAITSGQYLFIKNHSTLATGGYHATAAIASGASITSSNVAADANGIVNALDGKVSALNSKTTGVITSSNGFGWDDVEKYGKIVNYCGRTSTSQTAVTAKTWTEIGTLPSGFRPLRTSYIPILDYQNDGLAHIRLNTNGSIEVYSISASKQFDVSFTFMV